MSVKKDDLLHEVGLRVRKMRLAADIQQVQLAEEFQCAQSRISGIEKGTRDPGTDFYHWFADRTGCSLDYIIRGVENKRLISQDDSISDAGVISSCKNLIDSVIESDEIQNYFNKKIKEQKEYNQSLEVLSESEKRIVDALRKIDIERYDDVYDHINIFIK